MDQHRCPGEIFSHHIKGNFSEREWLFGFVAAVCFFTGICCVYTVGLFKKTEINSGMKMFGIIRHIIKKEFIQTFRDKRMLIPIFAAPVIQLILFGYAVTTEVKQTAVALMDYDHTQESRSLIASFESSDSFDLEYYARNYREVEDLILKGKIKAAVVVPVDFGKDLKNNAGTSVQVLLDGTDANSATIIQNYIFQLITRYSENFLFSNGNPGSAGIIRPRTRVWYNPELKSSVYMVPGVICLVLLLVTLILTSMGITREREMGTLEQIVVSPIKSWELILGKTIPFVVIGMVDIVLIIFAGKTIFSLPIRGNLFFLFGVALLFILTTLSLGLFISTVSRTQQQAMMSAFFFIMPAMLLSGIFTPIESMPAIVQKITLLNPLRYFSKAVRGILLKGNGISILWPQVLALFIFGLTAIIFSSLRFRKHLE
jgi:ABC-2 type transport system permease protein